MQQSIGRAIARAYEKRRENAEHEREQRVRSVYESCPQLQRIDRSIAASGADMLLEAIEPGRPRHASARKEQLEQDRLEVLRACNIDPAFDQVRYQCEECQDTGYIGQDKCKCYQQELIPLLVEQANIRPLSGAAFDQFDPLLFSDQADSQRYQSSRSPRQQIMGVRQASERFVEMFNMPETRNMLFVGSPGTGKTFLMGCISHALIEQGCAVFYTTAPQLFENMQERRTLRASFNPDPTRLEQAEAIYDLLLSCSLLLIDDLGTEVQAATRYADLLAIIDNRQHPSLKTIISSNADPSSLRDTYDERILSRLVGQFAIYRFFGEDLRLAQNRQRRR